MAHWSFWTSTYTHTEILWLSCARVSLRNLLLTIFFLWLVWFKKRFLFKKRKSVIKGRPLLMFIYFFLYSDFEFVLRLSVVMTPSWNDKIAFSVLVLVHLRLLFLLLLFSLFPPFGGFIPVLFISFFSLERIFFSLSFNFFLLRFLSFVVFRSWLSNFWDVTARARERDPRKLILLRRI